MFFSLALSKDVRQHEQGGVLSPNTLAIFSPKSIILTKPSSLIKKWKIHGWRALPACPRGLILSRLPLGPSSSLAKKALGRLALATAAAFSCVIPVRSVKHPCWKTAGSGPASLSADCFQADLLAGLPSPLPPLPVFPSHCALGNH